MSNAVSVQIRPAEKLFAYLQLARPANVVTAWADILAGYGAAGLAFSPDILPLLWLLLATTGLYAGGVTFNDVFDAELDAVERPERPIPSDRATVLEAALLGGTLLAIGILAAFQVSPLSAALAAGIALSALLYDKFGKHTSVFGPINMGLCRGGNLLLGMTAAGSLPLWFLLFIPLAYIGAVTAISRGEVSGGDRETGAIALLLLGVTLCALLGLSILPSVRFLSLLPFVLLLAVLTISPFLRATRMPDALTVRAAVKAGVLSLIVVDGAIAAGFAGPLYGLCVLALLPLSVGIARLFAVT